MSDSGYTAANGFYDSWSEFYDELAWAAIWIYLATNDSSYLAKAETYVGQMNTDWLWTHCWDDKGYGVYLMLAKITGNSTYISNLEFWLDWWMPGGGITYTGGGLPYLDTWGALRYAAAKAFLAKVWSQSPNCTSTKASTYSNFADNVVDYIKLHTIEIEYHGIGSGGGLKQIKAKTVDFGASDVITFDKENEDLIFILL